jgi:superfamily I DNA/RNA helicase
MTFHASKGLEFDHVWMIGCENNVIPDDESPTDEERRLFYVAMTRAKKTLTISWRKSDLLRGKEKDYHPSRFIREAFES